MGQETDSQLIQQVAQRHQHALSELYRRHYSCAYNTTHLILRNSESAQDAVQEAFLRVWHSAGSYRSIEGKSADGNGFMETTSKKFQVALEGNPSFPKTLHVSFSVRLKGKGKQKFNPRMWFAENKKEGVFLNAGGFNPIVADRWKTFHAYLSPEYSDLWIDNVRIELLYVLMDRPHWLNLNMEGSPYLIDDFSVKPIREADLPDLKRFREALQQIPPHRRQGKVLLNGLDSPRPGQKACLNFDRRVMAGARELVQMLVQTYPG